MFWGVVKSQLLVRNIRPHKPVFLSTASRWLGQVLAIAGVDAEAFKANSTRSASSSKADGTGFSLTDIIKQDHWSRASTFQRFYRKSIKEYDSNFQSGILNN